ncbi:MAG: AAA family ATPase [Gemmatimonadetes bacterium]|nr:AAA family ATPase [Gemmatimonadota bacterium]MYK52163.1 AAA family ATPase [Gemmatimonadota bacterium]
MQRDFTHGTGQSVHKIGTLIVLLFFDYYIAISTKNCYYCNMIHKFSISNFHSVREEVVLDLRIPGTAPDLPRFRRSTAKPDIRLPSVVVLIGPNGSGKTTLLSALVATAFTATFSSSTEEIRPIMGFLPFWAKETRNEPTRFCLEFEADWLGEAHQLFRYELAVVRSGNDSFFSYEALSHFPKGRPRRLFERGAPGEPIYVSHEFGLKPKDDRLQAVRADTSVIATLNLLNISLAMRIVKWMKEFLLSSNIMIRERWAPPTQTVMDLFEDNSDMESWVRNHIRSSDLGIQDITISEQSGKKEVFFNHHGLDMPIPLSFESSGTKRLFHLLPQIGIALSNGVPAVLDEIDADLHVDIASEILSWFRSQETNPSGAQLFVSSHNVGLLDNLEKEEIFIVEKDSSGATRVHGAQDVQGLRRDTRLYPKYRAGVLGGIPKIG